MANNIVELVSQQLSPSVIGRLAMVIGWIVVVIKQLFAILALIATVRTRM